MSREVIPRLVSRGKSSNPQSSEVPTASGTLAFSEIRKAESAKHETFRKGRRPKGWDEMGPLWKGVFNGESCSEQT
jgi:hypothetical protein